MATKRKTKKSNNPAIPLPSDPVVMETKTAEKPAQKSTWMVNLGWGLLLVGGLAHMLPTRMEPVLKLSQFGISVQMVVGVLSVLIALNFLLGDEN